MLQLLDGALLAEHIELGAVHNVALRAQLLYDTHLLLVLLLLVLLHNLLAVVEELLLLLGLLLLRRLLRRIEVVHHLLCHLLLLISHGGVVRLLVEEELLLLLRRHLIVVEEHVLGRVRPLVLAELLEVASGGSRGRCLHVLQAALEVLLLLLWRRLVGSRC